MSLVKTFLDLRDVVTSAVDLVRPMFPSRGQHIDVIVESDAPVMVSGDYCRLTQIMSNLLINAAKFTPDEGDILVVLTQNSREAIITVKDSGIGIAEEELAHIFEAFSRGQDEGAETADGLGLGLCVARKLVELHGGKLTGFSAGKGKGSEFIIRLPIAIPS
jgi:signal transduction histidine kinase